VRLIASHPTPQGQIVEDLDVSSSGSELNRLVERLTNFMYLIQHNSSDPAKIHFYIGLARETLARIKAINEANERQSSN
jgi:hypothetical protein